LFGATGTSFPAPALRHGSKYLGIILHSDLNWLDQVNVKNPGRHFILQYVFLKKGNSNTKSLAHTSLVLPNMGRHAGILAGRER
jgi:hypothetical protein